MCSYRQFHHDGAPRWPRFEKHLKLDARSPGGAILQCCIIEMIGHGLCHRPFVAGSLGSAANGVFSLIRRSYTSRLKRASEGSRAAAIRRTWVARRSCPLGGIKSPDTPLPGTAAQGIGAIPRNPKIFFFDGIRSALGKAQNLQICHSGRAKVRRGTMDRSRAGRVRSENARFFRRRAGDADGRRAALNAVAALDGKLRIEASFIFGRGTLGAAEVRGRHVWRCRPTPRLVLGRDSSCIKAAPMPTACLALPLCSVTDPTTRNIGALR